jgi:hypothetical protein
MKIIYIIIFLTIVVFLAGCGTPNDPESILGGDGGYKILGKCAVTAFAQDVIIKDSIVYMAQGEGGLMVLNASDPSHPQAITALSIGIRGFSYKLAMRDSIIYLATGGFGITSVSVADPYNPVFEVNNRSISPVKDFGFFNNFLFIATSEEGVRIAEISYPLEPDIRGVMLTPGYAQGIAATPDSSYAIVACGQTGLAFFDISELQNGNGEYPLVKLVDIVGYAENVVINPEMKTAYVASGTGGLAIVDYSDSSDIKLAGSFDTGGYAKEVYYQNNKIYITTEQRGLQIIDVTNPTNPVRIGTVQTKYAKGVTADDKYIYVADEDEGLIIISIPFE